mmetsp:Transcript_26639/g.37536  ORF Transcript_26639/g.37536 Transcript_26639/m.37536 type:complete len:182 (+) Transcript_26639:97-642(+)
MIFISTKKLQVAVALLVLLCATVAENNDTYSNDNDTGSNIQNTCTYISMDGECIASGTAGANMDSPTMAPSPVVAAEEDVPTAGSATGVASLVAEPVVGPQAVPSQAPTPRGLFGRFRKKNDRDDNPTIQAPKPTARPNKKKPQSASASAKKEESDSDASSVDSEGKKGKKGKKEKDGKKH